MTTSGPPPDYVQTEMTIPVRISNGDWLKIFAFAIAQLLGVTVWAVTMQNRVANLEAKAAVHDISIDKLAEQGGTLTRIDERTKEWDKRFERIERSVIK